jgi:hypothetical protein
MKARHYLLIPALAAMAVSCSSEADVLQPEQKADGTTVRATTEYTPATRTLFGTPTSADEGLTYTIPLTWNEDPTSESIDVAGLYAIGTPTEFASSPFTGVAGSRSNNDQSMEFTGTPPENEGKVAYFYPSGAFQSNGIFIIEKNLFTTDQTQTGNDNLAHLSGVNWMYSDAVDEGEDFTLHPMGAIVRFDLTFPAAVTGGTIKLSSSNRYPFISTVAIDYSGGTTSVSPSSLRSQSLKIEDISTDKVIAYMMVAAVPEPEPPATPIFGGLNSATLTLTATITTTGDGGTVVYTKSLGTTHSTATWEPGKTYNIVVAADEWTIAP